MQIYEVQIYVTTCINLTSIILSKGNSHKRMQVVPFFLYQIKTNKQKKTQVQWYYRASDLGDDIVRKNS